MALGLTPGTQIDVIRVAPMGDPVQIQVRNACLALRKVKPKNLSTWSACTEQKLP